MATTCFDVAALMVADSGASLFAMLFSNSLGKTDATNHHIGGSTNLLKRQTLGIGDDLAATQAMMNTSTKKLTDDRHDHVTMDAVPSATLTTAFSTLPRLPLYCRWTSPVSWPALVVPVSSITPMASGSNWSLATTYGTIKPRSSVVRLGRGQTGADRRGILKTHVAAVCINSHSSPNSRLTQALILANQA